MDTRLAVNAEEDKRKLNGEQCTIQLKEFERKIILQNECPAILPVSIMNEHDAEEFIFETRGHIRLSDSNFETLDGVFDIINKIVLSLHIVEDHLLAGEKVLLTPDNIYISKCEGKVRFKYGCSDRNSLDNKILNLIETQKYRKNILGLTNALQELEGVITKDNPCTVELLKTIEEIRREWNNIQLNCN